MMNDHIVALANTKWSVDLNVGTNFVRIRNDQILETAMKLIEIYDDRIANHDR